MYQTGFPTNVGRRRSKNAERMAEIFRQHFGEAKPNSASDKPNSVNDKTMKPRRGRKAKVAQ